MSVTQKIEKLLKRGESISPIEAQAVYGIIRLGSVIHRLRKKGMNIITGIRYDDNGKPYGRYYLAD